MSGPAFDAMADALRKWTNSVQSPPMWSLLQPLALQASQGATFTAEELEKRGFKGRREQAEAIARLLQDLQGELSIEPRGKPGGDETSSPTATAMRAPGDPVPTARELAASAPPGAQEVGSPTASDRSPSTGQLPGMLADYTTPDALAGFREGFVDTDPTRVMQATAHIKVTLRGASFLLEWPKWSETTAATVLYRVIAHPEHQPFLPDNGNMIGVTTGTRFLDAREPVSLATCYQVWAYPGDSVEDAQFCQPTLLAQSWLVAPPRVLDLLEDHGSVVGRWPTIEGRVVHVYRVPEAKAAYERLDDPSFRINTDSTNLGGFVDRGVEPGKCYVYALRGEGIAGGTRQFSPQVTRRICVEPAIAAVADFEAVERRTPEGRMVLDIMWTPPEAGTVEVYRSREQPAAGIDRQPRARSVLGQLGVGEPIPYPVSDMIGSRVVIRDIPWPEDWTRIHLTPVTTLGEDIFPGKTITRMDTQYVSISEAMIHERFGHQVVTLAWPERRRAEGEAAGATEYLAASVRLFLVRAGQDVASATKGEPLQKFTYDQYRNDGGVRVTLPPEGCRVALVPVLIHDGVTMDCEPTLVEYPGLRRLEYQLKAGLKIPMRKTRKASIRLRSLDGPLTDVPNLVLVHNEERLPLDRTDGTIRELTMKDDPGATVGGRIRLARLSPDWTGETWEAEVPAKGFARLFADVDLAELRTVAVLDAPLKNLAMG